MKNGIGLVIVSMILSGCVSTKNIAVPTDIVTKMKGKTLIVTTGEKPDFSAVTAGKAAFGLIGVIAMVSKGNQIINDNNVNDPALYIGGSLANALSKKRAIKVDTKVRVELTDEITDLTKKYNNKNYILDIRTIDWSFSYFHMDWDNYRVIYSNKLRLIDVHNSKVIAEGFCYQAPYQTEKSPSYDQLVGSNAKVLKNELKIYADKCLQEFKKNIFRLN
jgi:hypothetical protein